MPLDQFTALGVAAGLFTAFVGVSHLWPLVTTPAPNNTMLHALTSWALLPLGLLLALRDGNHAGVIHARDILGSHFQSAIELVETEPRFTVFLVWAGLTSFCYGGLYGLLAMVTCLARAGTLMHQVRRVIEQGTARLREELEKRGVKVPGFANPPAPHEEKSD